MGFVRQLIDALRGAERRSVIDSFVDRRKSRAKDKPLALPDGITFDRRKPPEIFGKLGTLPARHRPPV
jgi:hypothetical protein